MFVARIRHQPVGAQSFFIKQSQIQQVAYDSSMAISNNNIYLFDLIVFCLFFFQIKFEHFSSGFTDAVRRNQNASKRTGDGGCLHGASHHGTKTQHSSHGLRRRRRKSSATATPQKPRFVTPKVRTREGWRGGTHSQSGSRRSAAGR